MMQDECDPIQPYQEMNGKALQIAIELIDVVINAKDEVPEKRAHLEECLGGGFCDCGSYDFNSCHDLFMPIYIKQKMELEVLREALENLIDKLPWGIDKAHEITVHHKSGGSGTMGNNMTEGLKEALLIARQALEQSRIKEGGVKMDYKSWNVQWLQKQIDTLTKERDEALQKIKHFEEVLYTTPSSTFAREMKLESENSELKEKVIELEGILIQKSGNAIGDLMQKQEKLHAIESKKAWSREMIMRVLCDELEIRHDRYDETSEIAGFGKAADAILAILPASNPDMVRCPGQKGMKDLDDVMRIQLSDPSNKTDAYMRGLSNGLILAKATLENKEAHFINICPEKEAK